MIRLSFIFLTAITMAASSISASSGLTWPALPSNLSLMIDSNVIRFPTLTNAAKADWETILANGSLELSGTDEEIRPRFVLLQGILEQVLANELNKSIHELYRS